MNLILAFLLRRVHLENLGRKVGWHAGYGPRSGCGLSREEVVQARRSILLPSPTPQERAEERSDRVKSPLMFLRFLFRS